MTEQSTVEQRLAILEREVQELKQQLKASASSPGNWVERRSGSMIEFPEFDEVARLGREMRGADRLST